MKRCSQSVDLEKKVRKYNQEIYEMVPFFRDSVIFGDSLAESLLDYRLLRKNHVVAKRGRCIDDIDGDLLRIYALQPQIVFMEFGKNDMRHFQGDPTRFIEIYEKRIQQLFENGVVRIYVNSIIPMRHDMEKLLGGEIVFLRFNEAIKNMCHKLDVPFIDNTDLMSWEDDDFEYDGIHPKYPYYQRWLQHLITCANLDEKLVK